MRPNDPTSLEQAERQLLANRKALAERKNGRKNFCHDPLYRKHFAAHIKQLRAYIRRT